MKPIRSALFFLALTCCIVTAESKDKDEKFTYKSSPLGISIKTFHVAHREFECMDGKDPQAICHSKGKSNYGGKMAKEATAFFIDGKMDKIEILFDYNDRPIASHLLAQSHYEELKEALVKKYGIPNKLNDQKTSWGSNTNNVTSTWQKNGVILEFAYTVTKIDAGHHAAATVVISANDHDEKWKKAGLRQVKKSI